MNKELQNINEAFDEAMEAITKLKIACIELKKCINEEYLGRK